MYMLRVFVVLSLALLCASREHFQSDWFGGKDSNTRESTIVCADGHFVDGIKIWDGKVIDSMTFRCSNNNVWTERRGGGGGKNKIPEGEFPTGSRICGFRLRAGRNIDALQFYYAGNGNSRFYGGSGGTMHTDYCNDDSTDRNRALVGISIRFRLPKTHSMGIRLPGGIKIPQGVIEGLKFIWTRTIPAQFIQLKTFKSEKYNFEGPFAYQKFLNGSPVYHHATKDVALWAGSEPNVPTRWYIGSKKRVGNNNNVWAYCTVRPGALPQELHEHRDWFMIKDNGNGFNRMPVRPQVEKISKIVLPVEFGNVVGYWQYRTSANMQTTLSFSSSFTHTSTVQQTDEDSRTKEFSKTNEIGTTVSVSATAGAEFEGLSASVKWEQAVNQKTSTTNSLASSVRSTLSHSLTSSETKTTTCSFEIPNDGVSEHIIYSWNLYRPNNNMKNDGSYLSSCLLFAKRGNCRNIPPNCVPGSCKGECLECLNKSDQIESLDELRKRYGSQINRCLDGSSSESKETINARCGSSWEDANLNCDARECVGGADSECAGSNQCFAGLTAPSCGSSNPDPSYDDFAPRCGLDWEDANDKCANKQCPGKTDDECPGNQQCFGDLPKSYCGRRVLIEPQAVVSEIENDQCTPDEIQGCEQIDNCHWQYGQCQELAPGAKPLETPKPDPEPVDPSSQPDATGCNIHDNKDDCEADNCFANPDEFQFLTDTSYACYDHEQSFWDDNSFTQCTDEVKENFEHALNTDDQCRFAYANANFFSFRDQARDILRCQCYEIAKESFPDIDLDCGFAGMYFHLEADYQSMGCKQKVQQNLGAGMNQLTFCTDTQRDTFENVLLSDSVCTPYLIQMQVSPTSIQDIGQDIKCDCLQRVTAQYGDFDRTCGLYQDPTFSYDLFYRDAQCTDNTDASTFPTWIVVVLCVAAVIVLIGAITWFYSNRKATSSTEEVNGCYAQMA